MQDAQFEVLAVALSRDLLETCLLLGFLPPLIIHPSADHVREFVLFEYESDVVRAYAHISDWNTVYENSLIRTMRVNHIEETLEQEWLPRQLKGVRKGMDEAGYNFSDTSPYINGLAIHHHYRYTADPTHQMMIDEGVKRRTELYEHPLFEQSVHQLWTDPSVKTFFNGLGCPSCPKISELAAVG